MGELTKLFRYWPVANPRFACTNVNKFEKVTLRLSESFRIEAVRFIISSQKKEGECMWLQ